MEEGEEKLNNPPAKQVGLNLQLFYYSLILVSGKAGEVQSSYFILIQTYRTYTIAPTPKMVPLIGLLLESRKAFEEFYRCLAF